MAEVFVREFDLKLSEEESVSLLVGQRASGDVNSVVWDSALVAANFFQQTNLRKCGCFEHKHVLELGAGTGLCSLVLNLLGYDQYASFSSCPRYKSTKN